MKPDGYLKILVRDNIFMLGKRPGPDFAVNVSASSFIFFGGIPDDIFARFEGG
jgi:hypothetical protein